MSERFKSIEEFYEKNPQLKKPGLASSFAASQTAKRTEKKKKPPPRVPRMPDNAGISVSEKSPPVTSFAESVNIFPMMLAENQSIKIILPYPPGTNNLFDTFINPKTHVPRRVPTKRYVIWQQEARKVLSKCRKMVLKGNLGINIILYRPQRSGDWDGFLKAPQDILHDWFFANDNQIVEGHVYRRDDKENPRVELEIWEIY